jgi:hypothetical protein
MGELHSRKDDELERRDLGTFGHVVAFAGIALLLVFAIALLAVKMAGRHIETVNPDKHPTSQVIARADRWLV